jgi:hypothetical protein
VFALGTLACLAAAAAQQKGLSYHQYPPYALATTLLGLTVWSVAESAGHWIGTAYRVTATGVLAMVAVAAWARDASAAMRLVQDWEQVQLEGLIAVVGPLANGGTVYVMSYHIGSAYPLINYTGARSASRFPQLWILGSSYLEQLKGDRPLRYHAPEEMSPSESYLNQAVFEDLRDQEPDVLVVLQPARDLPVNGWRRLDYIAYFGRDPRIAGLLQRYQLAADLQGYLVYERVPDGADRVAPAPAVVPGTQDIVRGRPGDASARILDPEILLPLLAFAGAVALASRRGRPQAG